MNLFNIIGAFGNTAIPAISIGDTSYESIDADGQTLTGTLTISQSGAITYTGDSLGSNENGTWYLPANRLVADNWSVMLSYVSGTNQWTSGTALATWTAITSSRTFTVSKVSNGGPDFTNGVYTLAFSKDGGSTTYMSQNIDITLTEESP